MPLNQYYSRMHKKCCKSLHYLCQVVLGYKDMEKKHKDFCEFIESPAKKKFVVGSRGVFKTSIGTIGRAIQILMIHPNARILVVANIKDNAERIVLEIMNQFNDNETLRALMAGQIPETSRRWSKAELMLTRKGNGMDARAKEASVTAAGVETQLATNHYSHILGDDVVAAGRNDLKEDKVIVLRPEEVDKAIGWESLQVHGLSIRCQDPKDATEVQFIVNRWGVHDFANHMIMHKLRTKKRKRGYEYMEMAAYTDGQLTFPHILSKALLKEIEEDQGPWMFATQFLCQPYRPEDRGFPPEDNVYWDGVHPPESDTRNYRIYALMDIADKKNIASCYTACVVVWVDDQNHLWVGEAIKEKLDTPGKIALIHRMVRKYNLHKFYIEENLHHDTLEFTLKSEMLKAGLHYRVVALKHGNRPKDNRIMKLQPHHRSGAIHVKEDQKCLLDQMRDWPASSQKDVIDAFAYIMDQVKAPPGVGVAPQVIDPGVYTVRMAMDDANKHRYGGGGLFGSQHNESYRQKLQKRMRA